MTTQETRANKGQSEDKPPFLKITVILVGLGITANYSGFFYIRDAVLILTKDFNPQKRLMKDVFSVVAEKYGVTASGIDRAVRKSIEKAWLKGKIQSRIDIFGDGERPTNLQFIAQLSDYMRNQP